MHASRRLRPVAVSARLAPSHASYRDPELIWVTGRLMSPDRGFGTSCLLHCSHSANSEDSWKRFCSSRTRLRRLATLAFRCWIKYSYLLTNLCIFARLPVAAVAICSSKCMFSVNIQVSVIGSYHVQLQQPGNVAHTGFSQLMMNTEISHAH